MRTLFNFAVGTTDGVFRKNASPQPWKAVFSETAVRWSNMVFEQRTLNLFCRGNNGRCHQDVEPAERALEEMVEMVRVVRVVEMVRVVGLVRVVRKGGSSKR